MTFQTAALGLINNVRRSQNPPLRALLPSTTLQRVATDGPYTGCSGITVYGRCRDMIERNYLSHSIKDCGNKGCSFMMVAAGISFSGSAENVTYVGGVNAGQEEAAASNIHDMFMADPPHAANILNPAWTHVGVGYWVAAPGPSNQPATSTITWAAPLALNNDTLPPAPSLTRTALATVRPAV